MSDVFNSLPVDEFRSINEKKSVNVPGSTPIESPTKLDIRCGPMLKLFNCNYKNNHKYLASLMIVLNEYNGDIPEVSYKLGDINDTKIVDVGKFQGTCFYEHGTFKFYRYYIDLDMSEHEQVCHYYVEGETTGYWKFYMPSIEQSMDTVSFSCNGFSLACDADDYKSSLWYDVLNKHSKSPYHVMLGGGDQIYCDSVKVFSECMKEWAKKEDYKEKLAMKADQEFVDDLEKYYLNHYFGWFGRGFWKGKSSKYLDPLFPMTLATIPSINIYDDHDLIDGFGSYPEETMGCSVFKELGAIGFKYYMIFQQHQLPEEKLEPKFDESWINGSTSSNYIEHKSRSIFSQLGKEIGLLGLDCRTERSLDTIVKDKTYDLVFSRAEQEVKQNPNIKHMLVMLGVPILYPRLVWLELLLTSPVLKPLRKLAELGVINRGVLNEFDGSIEVLDDLNDHWCSKNHKTERNKLVKNLIDFGAKHGIRMTILSGDVHLCCIGRLKSRVHKHPTIHPIHRDKFKEQNKNSLEAPEYDPRLIFNVTSSAIINAPPPSAMANLLNKRSKVHHFNKNCDEDVVPLFNVEPDGKSRENLQFLNKRNWCDLKLAKFSSYKDEVDKGTKKFPASTKKQASYTASEKFIKYPLLPNSLVTTLHVEDDPNDFDCKTMDYELLIPPLLGAFELDKAAIKHLNDGENETFAKETESLTKDLDSDTAKPDQSLPNKHNVSSDTPANTPAQPVVA